MAQLLKAPQAYGLSEPVISVTPLAQIIDRVPNGSLQGVLGQLQIFNDTAYMLTGVVAGQSVWTALGGGGGTFDTLTVTGDANIGGDLTVLQDITVSQNLGVIGNITSGGQISSQTDILATGLLAAESLYATGDGAAGDAGVLGITNVTNVTQGAGTLSIASTNGNNGDNTGFIKFYIGATPVFVPYFATIAP